MASAGSPLLQVSDFASALSHRTKPSRRGRSLMNSPFWATSKKSNTTLLAMYRKVEPRPRTDVSPRHPMRRWPSQSVEYWIATPSILFPTQSTACRIGSASKLAVDSIANSLDTTCEVLRSLFNSVVPSFSSSRALSACFAASSRR